MAKIIKFWLCCSLEGWLVFSEAGKGLLLFAGRENKEGGHD